MTIGNLITNTRIISYNYENPKIGKLFLRTIFRVIPHKLKFFIGSFEDKLGILTINNRKFKRLEATIKSSHYLKKEFY